MGPLPSNPIPNLLITYSQIRTYLAGGDSAVVSKLVVVGGYVIVRSFTQVEHDNRFFAPMLVTNLYAIRTFTSNPHPPPVERTQ